MKMENLLYTFWAFVCFKNNRNVSVFKILFICAAWLLVYFAIFRPKCKEFLFQEKHKKTKYRQEQNYVQNNQEQNNPVSVKVIDWVYNLIV